MARVHVWLSWAALSLVTVGGVLWATLVIAASDPQAVVQPLSQGPAQGTSAQGAIADTAVAASLEPLAVPEGGGRVIPTGRIQLVQAPEGTQPLSSPPPGSNEVDDTAPQVGVQPEVISASLVASFEGPPDIPDVFGFFSIPLDPITAVGPNHVIGAVNTSFEIFSKSGAMQARIDATVWFENVLPGLGDPRDSPLGRAFDPKIIFDHFENRWVLVYLAVDRDPTTQSWILVSVSDDADPHGSWCNWALRGDLNGSTPAGNWADYQGLGFDDQAVYIVPNQFGFGGGFDYSKIRILPKSTLYNPSCPAITWTDIWDVRFPGAGFDDFAAATVRPAVTFGTPGVEYLMANSYFLPPFNNFMVLYTLTNPLNNPTLTAAVVTVAPYEPPPNANQRGGSAPDPELDPNCANPCLIDTGGNRIRNVVYRDGSVWTAHSVADTGSPQLARARYVRVAAGGPTLLEDVAFGSPDCWYYYPALTTDADSNMVMVFNRSCSDSAAQPEYAGSRYATRIDGATLQPSVELKAGEANYVKTYGGSRNRWGDYSGAAVDPADPSSIWIFGEYAASPEDTWGTWFGQIQFADSSPVASAQTVTTTVDTPVAITLTGSDPAGDPLTFIITSLPGTGDLSEGATSISTVPHVLTGEAVTYTPDAGFTDVDSFGFRVNDGAADSDPASVRIIVFPPGADLVVTKIEDTNDGACDADCSLREAIAAAGSGDAAYIPGGTYTLTLGLELTVNRSLILTGAGSGDTIIQAAATSGDATSRVFNVTGGSVAISGVTIRHGKTTGDGGGIYNSGTLTLTDSTVTGNAASGGFSSDGGGILNRGTVTLNDSWVRGNSASAQGGGIRNEGDLVAIRTTIADNTAVFGGWVSNWSAGAATLTLLDSAVSGNGATIGDGGGIDNYNTLTVLNSTVNANVADQRRRRY